jgi:hypothetical protein
MRITLHMLRGRANVRVEAVHRAVHSGVTPPYDRRIQAAIAGTEAHER